MAISARLISFRRYTHLREISPGGQAFIGNVNVDRHFSRDLIEAKALCDGSSIGIGDDHQGFATVRKLARGAFGGEGEDDRCSTNRFFILIDYANTWNLAGPLTHGTRGAITFHVNNS
jgi:hypothetical protein